MLAFVTSQTWYFWVILGVVVGYIALIFFFCTNRAPESYDGKDPKICIIISALTIVLIITSIVMIFFASR